MKVIIFLFFLTSLSLYAQFGPQQVISTNISYPYYVVTADIDGDDDMDIVATSQFDHKVVWYQNLDGLGNFSKENLITDNLGDAIGLFASDLDGDNAIDVIAAAATGDKVVWFRNMDGLGNFSVENIIASQIDGALSVFAADIDGDSDMDVVSASFVDNTVAWYKNTNGLGNFGPQQIIHNQAFSVRQIHVADIDGDNDMDVIAAAAGSDEVMWYQNLDGLGTFGAPQVLTNSANGVISVFAVDIDGDNDLDILAAALSDDQVIWFENLDGQGSFGPKQIVAENLQTIRDVKAADIDNDNDMDVLCAFFYQTTETNGAIAWIENLDGFGNFGVPKIISTELSFARMAYPSDLDGDGDQDVVSTSSSDEKVAWYENYTILGTTDLGAIGIKIYPNPVKETLVIESPIAIERVTIYNILGSQLLEVTENTNEISMANLSNGILLVEITTEKGTVLEKLVKE